MKGKLGRLQVVLYLRSLPVSVAKSIKVEMRVSVDAICCVVRADVVITTKTQWMNR